MDIAKIRKKLKDAEVKQSAGDVKTPETEEKTADSLLPVPGSFEDNSPEPETAATGPGLSDMESSAGEERKLHGHEEQTGEKNDLPVIADESGPLKSQEELKPAAAEPPATKVESNEE